jgi:GABA permease
MRVPVRSEAEAFRLTLGFVAVGALAVILGAAVGPVAGVALIAGVALGATGVQLSRHDPDRATLRELHPEQAPDDGRHRLLVIANQTVVGDELRQEIVERAGRHAVVRVVAPVLPSRTHYVTSDIDRELRDAQDRLDATLAWLRSHELEATGRVGDLTPRRAIEDELRTFAADEVLISTHPAKRSHWLESGLLRQARDELDIPVAHVVVDLERQAAASSGASSPA